MTPSTNTDMEIALAALKGALGSPLGDSLPVWEQSSSNERASAITRHRLSRVVVNSAHPVELDAGDFETVSNDALAHTYAAFRLVGHTAQVAQLFETENINFLVIKGVALGALSQTPAGRGAGDVDILVEPRDVPRVHEMLGRGGFRPALALPNMLQPGLWRVWSFLDREATYLGHNTHIDLHWRISSQRHLFPTFSTLHARKTAVTVGEVDVPTLSLADSVAAACYHAYFDQFQPLRSLVDVVAVVNASHDTTLPQYSPKLQRLIAGVLGLTRTEFPGAADDAIDRLTDHLPAPPAIVAKRFEQALLTPKVAWEEDQNTGALWSKILAEAPFDSPIDIIPRFIGKRLFHFPHWSERHPTTSLAQALGNRIRVESARR